MNTDIDRRIPAFAGGFSPMQQQQRGAIGREAQPGGASLMGPQLADIMPAGIPTWAKILGGATVLAILIALISVATKKR